ncbi:(2Fe-2S) ferredoxin domain-containing protein [Deinococcus sp. HMF7620]|uniref:(2Fe-2S) ferredoxin domain-containing protein n=1 Tax=Deinococcus arboris TaxID=2682977 RepID=A0A7C9LLP3_9DEIO|nr:NAD(P)H-dependent oxidoreductase subunit E [Deinococcus arboris]MVN85836.1 (2Fe-2S) ferredoxin domain-containing protein [Deinococcus arboris]
MAPKFFATRAHLLVCQGQSCQGRGSALLYKALWNHLERQSLAYYKKGGSLRLTESGCLGACSYGPTLCVYRPKPAGGGLEEAWYAAVDFPLATRIAGAAHEETPLPEEHRYGPE